MDENNDNRSVKHKVKELEKKSNEVNHNSLTTLKRESNVHEPKNIKMSHNINDCTISEPLLNEESGTTQNRSFISENNDILKQKECWICLSQDPNVFLCPCQCKGSTKYVHKQCFLDFIQSKKIENLQCTFCKADYLIKSRYDNFIIVFEKIRKINFYTCQFIFIAYTIFLAYSVLFLYGIAVVFLFVGYEDLVQYMYDPDSIFPYSLINIVRLAINLPIVPVCLLLSTHKKFSYIFHILPTLILFESFEWKYFPFYFSPLLLFLYNKMIGFIEKKFGKRNGEASILVNNHSFEIKIITGTLISPFVGIFIGETLFCGYKKKALRSFYGCVLYTLAKDLCGIYYLISLRKRIRTLEIGEYN